MPNARHGHRRIADIGLAQPAEEHNMLAPLHRPFVPWVFHRTKKGRPLKGFTMSWRAACLAASSPGRIPHGFRRTAGVYRRYAIVDEVMLREGGAKLATYSAAVRPT